MEPVITIAAVVMMGLLLVAIVLYRFRAVRGQNGREVIPDTGGVVGRVGVVRNPVGVDGSGQILVRGELWRAVPQSPEEAAIPEGTEVEVVELNGLTAVVRSTEGDR